MATVEEQQQRILANIRAWVAPVFDAENITEENGRIAVKRGSARVFVAPLVSEGTQPLIRMTAIVVRQPELSFELLKMLMEENSTLLFARFCLSALGDINLEYCMNAECSEAEFIFALVSTLDDANGIDDEIVHEWGGQTYEEWTQPVEDAEARSRVSRLIRRGHVF